MPIQGEPFGAGAAHEILQGAAGGAGESGDERATVEVAEHPAERIHRSQQAEGARAALGREEVAHQRQTDRHKGTGAERLGDAADDDRLQADFAAGQALTQAREERRKGLEGQAVGLGHPERAEEKEQ